MHVGFICFEVVYYHRLRNPKHQWFSSWELDYSISSLNFGSLCFFSSNILQILFFYLLIFTSLLSYYQLHQPPGRYILFPHSWPFHSSAFNTACKFQSVSGVLRQWDLSIYSGTCGEIIVASHTKSELMEGVAFVRSNSAEVSTTCVTTPNLCDRTDMKCNYVSVREKSW